MTLPFIPWTQTKNSNFTTSSAITDLSFANHYSLACADVDRTKFCIQLYGCKPQSVCNEGAGQICGPSEGARTRLRIWKCLSATPFLLQPTVGRGLTKVGDVFAAQRLRDLLNQYVAPNEPHGTESPAMLGFLYDTFVLHAGF